MRLRRFHDESGSKTIHSTASGGHDAATSSDAADNLFRQHGHRFSTEKLPSGHASDLSGSYPHRSARNPGSVPARRRSGHDARDPSRLERPTQRRGPAAGPSQRPATAAGLRSREDRKSTRLNSSHSQISYAVFCLKKKKNHTPVRSAS